MKRDVQMMFNNTTEGVLIVSRRRRHLVPPNALSKRALAPAESLAVIERNR